MKVLFLFLLFSLLVFSAGGCKEVKKASTPAGVNVMIHDISCQEVLVRIQKELKRQDLPFEWADKDQSLLLVGPVTTTPLPADPFIKMEENSRLEIKCLAPLSTRLALQLHLKGLGPDNRWTEITDPDKLNAYGKRFLDRLIIH
ncbi:MAG: hypothetical protein C0407_16170 [Desulfobacca sp.]|nr:hypothetical protein [Desulfobacca sp.]